MENERDKIGEKMVSVCDWLEGCGKWERKQFSPWVHILWRVKFSS